MRKVQILGRAWQPPGRSFSVDATVEVSLEATGRHPLLALFHGRLVRALPTAPFMVNLPDACLDELASKVHGEIGERIQMPTRDNPGRRLPPGEPCRIAEAGWYARDFPIPETRAPRHAGPARDFVNASLRLRWTERMQDWPLEVSDGRRLAEFCAFHDKVTDPLVRFAVMQLALYSLEDACEGPGGREAAPWPWFETRLRRDFALHGHSILYWAALERSADDPEFDDQSPEFVFKISRFMRRIWETSLVPIAVERVIP